MMREENNPFIINLLSVEDDVNGCVVSSSLCLVGTLKTSEDIIQH